MKARRKGPRTARSFALAERQAKAVELRKKGYSFPEIAKALGCAVGTAYNDVNRALSDLATKTSETVEQHRALDLARTDALIKGLFTRAARGGVSAVEALLKVLQRRAKLLGLDAATKIEATGKDGAPLLPDAGDARAALAAALAGSVAIPDAGASSGGSGESA